MWVPVTVLCSVRIAYKFCVGLIDVVELGSSVLEVCVCRRLCWRRLAVWCGRCPHTLVTCALLLVM